MLITENMDKAGRRACWPSSSRPACSNAISSNPARPCSKVNHGKHHDHLVCVECGKVEEFFDPEIEKRQNAVAEERSFTIQDHALYIYGRCAGCGAKKT